MHSLHEIVILGGSGEMGGLFSKVLATPNSRITTVDLSEASPERVAAHLRADLTEPSPNVLHLLEQADCVLITLPERIALTSANWVLAGMKPNALWVDTLSVKTSICRLLESTVHPAERLSLNPMFAPSLGFQGQVVAAVEVSSGEKTREFEHVLASAGAIVQPVSAEAHDAATGSIQVATHAAILCFGATLLATAYDASVGWKLSTPPHRILVAALNRVVRGDPEVYWSIQSLHQDASRIRAELTRATTAFENIAGGSSPDGVERLFNDLKEMLGALQPELDQLTDRIVAASRA